MATIDRALLDTHALLWWLFDDPRLPGRAREVIRDAERSIYASSASAWEIATKHRLGKLAEAGTIADDLPGLLQRSGFVELPITISHALLAGALEITRRDPFDRMLAAQCLLEHLPLITRDPFFREAGVETIWD